MPHKSLLFPARRVLLSCFTSLVIAMAALYSAPAQESNGWRFVFFADTQDPEWGQWMNTNIMMELAVAITNEHPEFVLFGGDLANHPQPPVPPTWTNLMSPVYAAGIPIYATLGNHDKWEVPGFRQAFAPVHPDNGPNEEKYLTYALTHRNALVLGLNAFNPTNEYRVDQRWVDAVLATNAQPHVFAFSHPPAFKLQHGDCLGTYPEARDALWRSLLRVGCRMYFSGHDHFYDHSRIDDGDGNPNNDIHQFIVGTGGAAFYPDSLYDGTNGAWTPKRVLHLVNYGYLVVHIEGDSVIANWRQRTAPGVYTASPDVFTYSLRKPPTLQAGWSPQGALTLTWEGPAELEVSESFTQGFTNIPFATSPYTLTNLQSQQLFFRLKAE